MAPPRVLFGPRGDEVPQERDLLVVAVALRGTLQGDLENAKLKTIRGYLDAVGGSLLLEYVMGDERVQVA